MLLSACETFSKTLEDEDENTMKLLTVIPARGGSKGIRRKNLARFRGRPLIDYTLDAAKEACLGHVIVSSEDPEILSHCAQRGFALPYTRPTSLASDTSPVVDTVLHAWEWATVHWGSEFDWILMLQPTSPLRQAQHILEFISQLDREEEAIISVSPMSEHPMECIELVSKRDQEWRYLIDPPSPASQRQSFPADYFFINGALYAATPTFLSRFQTFTIPGRTRLYEMERRFSLDVDYPEDLAL